MVYSCTSASVVIGDAARAAEVAEQVPPGTEVQAGAEALADMGTVADVCVNGVVGFAGLRLTLATLAAGRRLALANKESLIAGGPVVRAALAAPGAGHIVPVDSEHGAVHQCLAANVSGAADQVARIVLTASGGPFRGRSRDDLARVTVDDADYVRLTRAALYEYLAKKDYTDSWFSEANEAFCFYSPADWIRVLEDAGFLCTPETRAIRNPWLIENRFSPAAEVFTLDEDGNPRADEWSWTNVLLVAEKPRS